MAQIYNQVKWECVNCGYEVFDTLSDYLVSGGHTEVSRSYLVNNHILLGIL